MLEPSFQALKTQELRTLEEVMRVLRDLLRDILRETLGETSDGRIRNE